MNSISIIEVFISDRRVGRMALTRNGKGELTLSDTIAVASEVVLSKQHVNQIIEELTEKCLAEKMLNFKIR